MEENRLDELSEMAAADPTAASAATDPVPVGKAELRRSLDAAVAGLA